MNSALAIKTKVSDRLFNWVHTSNLIYNTCWEDPAVDRLALNLSNDDRLLVISSAGCNALDYLLAGCGEVHAVDINPIQNALLELKVAALRRLDFGDFDQFFGDGRHPQAERIYHRDLRADLSITSRQYWDRNILFFGGKGWRNSFYYRGTSGLLAKFLIMHLFHVKTLRKPLEDLLNARSLAAQKTIYEAEIKPRLWTKWMHWALSRDVTMSLMGVPPSQKEHMTNQSPGGIGSYIERSLEAVLTELPFYQNYFYRVYIEGRYPREHRPEYIKEENFETLRHRISHLQVHTGSVAQVLEKLNVRFSRFVLLDHMDWLSSHKEEELRREWNAIVKRATSSARVIYRSAAQQVTYLDDLEVLVDGQPVRLKQMLTQNHALAERLHAQDRVHTYASFHIADLP
jgi:S-adenosylmethionine-diacylglycerol 3-amino-3-carboxypropyl transferase